MPLAAVKTASCVFLLLLAVDSHAQKAEKEIDQNVMFWTSINSTMRFSNHWGLMADFHIRRTDFIANPSFYFARAGAVYWFQSATGACGYANLLLAPAPETITTWSDEHRIYQQLQYVSTIRETTMSLRLRNEQRWKQEVDVAQDKKTGDYKFSNRVRFLLSFTIPVCNNKKIPSLALADEMMLQFGDEVVYNTFDQNRFFIGIKQDLGNNFSVDLGYMHVFQQKASGYRYDSNHTLRVFFYYTPDFRKIKIQKVHYEIIGDE